MNPPFTKDELADYVKERGYTANIEDMYDYFEQTDFKYVQGKLRIPLKNWKANVIIKLRNGKFGAKKITKAKELTETQARRNINNN